MSLLVRYTLKNKADHDAQRDAMEQLVSGLKSEGIPDLHYSCFSTEDLLQFIGVLEFADEEGKQAFLGSAAFARYRARVAPTFANPPQTTEIAEIASTKR
jgi:quinol monooxygenase YgiN